MMVKFAESTLVSVDPNRGTNLFEAAVVAGQADLVGMILETARTLDLDMVLVHRQGYRGFTPLHRAVFAGQLDTARVLIDAGADTTVRDRSGRTPAMVNRLTHQFQNPKTFDDFNSLLGANGPTVPQYLHR